MYKPDEEEVVQAEEAVEAAAEIDNSETEPLETPPEATDDAPVDEEKD